MRWAFFFMVSVPVETPVEVPADQAPPEAQTEAPATEPVVESAAAPPAEAAAPEPEQASVVEPKPDYVTREELEAERKRAAADAIEGERHRRQTENARKANAERRQAEDTQLVVNILKASYGAKGVYEHPDDAAVEALTMTARKMADAQVASYGDIVGPAWDWASAVIYGKEPSSINDLPDEVRPAAAAINARIQHLVNAMWEQIETTSRKGYVPESELPKIREAAVAAHNAAQNAGAEDLKRPPDGAPALLDNSTVAERLDRIGTSRETPGDRQWWNEREKARGRG